MSQPVKPSRAARTWTRLRPIAIKLLKIGFGVFVALGAFNCFGEWVFEIAAGIACWLVARAIPQFDEDRRRTTDIKTTLVVVGFFLIAHGVVGLDLFQANGGWYRKPLTVVR